MRHAGRDPDAPGAVSAMARDLGVSYQAVKKLLDGASKSLASRNNAKAAEVLGVRSQWLATGDGPMLDGAPPPQQWPFRDLSPERWSELDERDRGAIEAAAIREWQAIQERRRALGEFDSSRSDSRPRRAAA